MLYGYTVPQVGLATHYHTDWVHPVWSAQMDKLAQVGTHLFFRWHGAWGRPGAMSERYAGDEPGIAALSGLSPTHAVRPTDGLESAQAEMGLNGSVTDETTVDTTGANPVASLARQNEDALVVNLAGGGGDGSRQAMAALGKCASRNVCKLIGYVDGDRKRMAFLYVRDRREKVEQAFWDCEIFPRAQASDCLTAQTRGWLNYSASN